MGFNHGLSCAGCCWLLMALLFVAGVMNLLWVAAITIFVLLEKLIPTIWLSRLSGVALIAWGLWMFIAR
jgi:predicted metal-binding membrane protein